MIKKKLYFHPVTMSSLMGRRTVCNASLARLMIYSRVKAL